MDEEPGMEWAQFGMDRQPFRAAVDPESYFPSAVHEAALAAIADSFARREPIVLIDGPTGVGKTLIVRKWLDHLLPDVTRLVIPNPRADRPSELHQAILFDLALPYQGLSEQELRLAVTGYVLDAAGTGTYPTVLMLDEAQHLGDSVLEELRLLGNLETRRGTAIFVVLVAQRNLRGRLGQPVHEMLAQRLATRLSIHPLSLEESAEYLRHQVRAAGGNPDKIFAEETIPLLAGACHGVPRLLNRTASLALELAASSGADQADVEAVLEALERLGLAVAEPNESAEPVLLPHPASAAGSAKSRRVKSSAASTLNEVGPIRGSKDKPSRKRTA